MSMHLAMGCVLIQVFNFRKAPHIQKRNSAIIVGGLTSFIIYHCLTDEFVLHVAIFFTLSVTVSRMTSKITKETVKDPEHKRQLNTLTKMATCKSRLTTAARDYVLTPNSNGTLRLLPVEHRRSLVYVFKCSKTPTWPTLGHPLGTARLVAYPDRRLLVHVHGDGRILDLPRARREPWRGLCVAGQGRSAGSGGVFVARFAEEDGYGDE